MGIDKLRQLLSLMNNSGGTPGGMPGMPGFAGGMFEAPGGMPSGGVPGAMPGINPMADRVGGGMADMMGGSSSKMRLAGGKKKDRGFMEKLRDSAEAIEAWQYKGTPVGQTLRTLREGREQTLAEQEAAKAKMWWEMQKLMTQEGGLDRRQTQRLESQEAVSRQQQEAIKDRVMEGKRFDSPNRDMYRGARRARNEALAEARQADAANDPERAAEARKRAEEIEAYLMEQVQFNKRLGIDNPFGKMGGSDPFTKMMQFFQGQQQ